MSSIYTKHGNAKNATFLNAEAPQGKEVVDLSSAEIIGTDAHTPEQAPADDDKNYPFNMTSESLW